MPNHVANILSFECSEEEFAKISDAIKSPNGPIDFDRIIPEDKGAPSWYDWRIDNWGTKWNAYGFNLNHPFPKTIIFQTAWTAPLPIVRKLSEMFPDIPVTIEWSSEDHGYDVGSARLKGGKSVKTVLLESGDRMAELADKYVWDRYYAEA